MLGTLIATGILLLSTENLCDQPILNDDEFSGYCFIKTQTVIETPHFSIQAPRNSLVSIEDVGRSIAVSKSITHLQSIHVLVKLVPDTETVGWFNDTSQCRDRTELAGGIVRCRTILNGDVSVSYLFRREGSIATAHILSEPGAAGYVPMFMDMVEYMTVRD